MIPLNETSGIIEWVDNLTPLRNVLSKLYKEKCGPNLIAKSEINTFATREDDPVTNRKNFDILIKR